MCLALADDRPAHLTRVHQALTALPEDDQRRLGVIADWKAGPHLLTYRQTEHTFGLVAGALAKDEPDGLPSPDPAGICDDLLEATIPDEFKDASTSLAVDWTDLESFSRPPPHGTSDCADPEASWGHRKNNLLRSEDELFYGYYLSAGVMVPEENGPAVPELARRATVSSCRHDPVRAFAPVLTAMPGQGIPLGDILADSGYAHRDAGAWAIPLRAAGAAARPGPAPPRPRPQGHPRRRRHQQRQPVLPPDTAPAAGTRAARPRPPPGSRPRTTNARPPSWPATSSAASPPTTPTATTACSAPPPWARSAARSARASMTLDRDRPEILQPPEHPPGLLRPADDHRPAGRHRQDRAETRLPVRGLAPLLRPPHRRRARLRHRQGPRQQRHQPRLVPPHGPGTPDAVRHDPAHRPQPAHPHRLERPAGRNPAPRRRRAAPENPQTPPQDPRRPRRRAALTTPPPHRTRHGTQPGQPPQPGESTP